MSLVQLSCLVHTASSGNANTSGLFSVFMVLWVLSYMSKVPGAQQCTTHNRKKPLQPEVWWELQESSSAAAGPLSCHTVQCSPTSAGVTTTKVSLLSEPAQPSGHTLTTASSTHTLYLDVSLSKTHTLLLPPPNLHFLPLSSPFCFPVYLVSWTLFHFHYSAV